MIFLCKWVIFLGSMLYSEVYSDIYTSFVACAHSNLVMFNHFVFDPNTLDLF